MDADHDIAALLAWDTGGPLPQDSLQRVFAHPRLAEASRALARNMLEAGAADHRLDGIMKDAGRYLASAWAAYLHGAGELTLPRLKEAGVASGFLSSGRSRDLLNYLLHLGFIELTEQARAGTPARYALTPAFVTAWRSHLRAALGAARVIEPAVGPLLEGLDAPGTFAAFARVQGAGLLELSNQAAQTHPYVRIFMHRHAGTQVVWALLVDGEDGFPSGEAIPVAVAGLARRFGVSRTHIKRMFDEAEQAGLISRTPEGAVRFEPAGREYIRWTYAAQLLALLIAAARTTRTLRAHEPA